MRFVEDCDEPLCHFANTFKILDIISPITIDSLTQNVFLHSMQWFFNIFDIGDQMLHWPTQRDHPKFAVPRILIHSLIDVVIQLDVDYISIVVCSVVVESRCNILSMLLSHVEDVSVILLTLGACLRVVMYSSWRLSNIAIGSSSTMLSLSHCTLSW